MKFNALVAVLFASFTLIACQGPSSQPNMMPNRTAGEVIRQQDFVDDVPVDLTKGYEGINLQLLEPQFFSPGRIKLQGRDAKELFDVIDMRPFYEGEKEKFTESWIKEGNHVTCREHLLKSGGKSWECEIGIDYVAGTLAGYVSGKVSTEHFYHIFNNPHDDAAGVTVTKLYRGMNLTLAPADAEGYKAGMILLLNQDANALYNAMTNIQEANLEDGSGTFVKDSGTIRCTKEKKDSKATGSKVTYSCRILIDYDYGDVFPSNKAINPAITEI